MLEKKLFKYTVCLPIMMLQLSDNIINVNKYIEIKCKKMNLENY